MKTRFLSVHTLFYVAAFIVLLISLNFPVINRGDSLEYNGMTISIANHASPDLRVEDINDRKRYLKIDMHGLPDDIGYIKDLTGVYYSVHFWFYSAICVPVYQVIKWFGGNPLKTFASTNTILMIMCFWWTIYRSKLNYNAKLWITICLLFCPIWFYIAWPHPEVYSFAFLFIGLLDYLDKRRVTACLFTAVASFQNPSISLVTLFILMHELYDQRNTLKSFRVPIKLIYMGCLSLLIFLPYIWYWYHYHIFSLIAKYSAATKAISFAKVFSIFFDPNFGMILYTPLIFCVFIWCVLKRNLQCMIWASLLIAMSIVCATQFNWNSDMNYIQRYAVWMIPFIMVGTIPFVISLNKRAYYTMTTILTITSLALFLYYAPKLNNTANSVQFQPVAKFLLIHAPVLYYSPPEVFIERALGREIPIWDIKSLEDNNLVSVVNNKGNRKVFVYYHGLSGYLNGPLSWDGGGIKIETSK